MHEPYETHPSDRRAAAAPPAPASLDLEALGERIAELSAQIQAATYHLLLMLRTFDERGGWNGGFRSCAHWLNWRTGLDLGAAREKVRVAHALAGLPQIAEAMRRGELSFSKVRALTRVASPATEGELLVFAKAGTASHVEKLVRAWRRVDRIEEMEEEKRRHESRYLRVYTDEDGMVVVQARLAPEAGAALLRALDAAREKLYDESREGRAAMAASPDEVTAEQRRADALGLVAESALAGGLDPRTRGDRYQVVVHVEAGVLAAPGGARSLACEDHEDVSAETPLVAGSPAAPAPAAEGLAAPAGRPPILPFPKGGKNVSAETSLAPAGRPPVRPYLEDGPHVAAETCRRLACDCSLVVMRHEADGTVLDVGRRTRTIPPALRRALAHRDRGCRFPGCGLALCDHHHLLHWADGGETKLHNLVRLCRRHHRAVHEEGFRVEWTAGGELRFFRPDGRLLVDAPPLPPVHAESLPDLTAHWTQDGIPLTDDWSEPSWDGEPVDYGWAIDYLRQAAPLA